MDFNNIINDINQNKFFPVYFLCGEEPFFIDRITDLIENKVLPLDERDFNQTVVYGNETNISTIIDAARRYPMMAQRQTVIVKEAQNLDNIDLIEGYLSHIQPTTLLLFAFKKKTPDKRKKFMKIINDSSDCVLFESKKLYDNQVADWINSYCKEIKQPITPKAAVILAQNFGTDLSRIYNEIEKLKLVSNGKIDENLLDTHSGISKDYNIFELQEAIDHRDILKANQIVNYFQTNPKSGPLPMIIPMLYNHFLRKLTYHYEKKNIPNSNDMAKLLGIHPFFMKDFIASIPFYSAGKCARIISMLREYDMKSKGANNVNTDDGEILKELIFKIIH